MQTQEKNQGILKKEATSEDFRTQYELLKVIAELNHEKIFEFDLATRNAYLYEVKNGQFVVVKEFLDCENNDWVRYTGNVSQEDIPAMVRFFEQCVQKPSQMILDFRMHDELDKDEYRWYRFYIVSTGDLETHEVTHVAGRLVCIDQEKQATEIIRKKAELDALTGVYNHTTFESVCESKLIRHKSELIFIMLDVDDFKLVNDTQGHNVGDMVLNQTGSILSRMVAGRGLAGRLGGDEFAAMVWSFKSDAEIRDFVIRLQNELKTIIFDMEYSASIGVSVRRGRTMTFKDMYYEADQGVYSAKKNGKNRIVYFNEIDKAKAEAVNEIGNAQIIDQDAENLNDHSEMIMIVDEETHQVIFANQPLRERLGMSMEQLKNGCCTSMLFGKEEGCASCQSRESSCFVIDEKKNPNPFLTGHFKGIHALGYCQNIVWKGKSSRFITLVDLENEETLQPIMELQLHMMEMRGLCLQYLNNAKLEDRIEKVLYLLMDFYDADCISVMEKKIDNTESVHEVHREHAQTMAKIIKESAERGGVELYENTFADSGMFYLKDVAMLKGINRQAYENLVEARIWSSYAGRLFFQTEYVGNMVVLNPRRNLQQKFLLEQIADMIASDLLHRRNKNLQEYQQTHDLLTNLWNRESIFNWQEIWETGSNTKIGVIYTDIIELKRINDMYGYARGNDYICQVAKVMLQVFKGYRVFRFEQDCIVAICTDMEENFLDIMVQTTKENLGELDFGVALGYSWGMNRSLQELVHEAEDVMQVDKVAQKKGEHIRDKERQKALRELREQIDAGNFIVYFQPKMNIRFNRLMGAEALLRFKDADHGILGPALFIPVLEELDLVYMADLFVLESVFRFQRKRLMEDKLTVPIAVNFSKRTLLYTDLLERVSQMVEAYDIPSNLIEIEITETIGDMEHQVVAKIAKALHAMGFSLSMDDFGTKYSNLAMLSQFDFDVAKIDRSIIMEVTSNNKSMIVLKHLTAMIKELGIRCIIEGVETEEQMDLIRQTQCDQVQGYYYSPPIPVDDFVSKYMDK